MTMNRMFLFGLTGYLVLMFPVWGSNALNSNSITLFLCGDVMTGRGIDQILPYSCAPQLYERYVKDAREYVVLAERANGPVAYPVNFFYIWGDALDELEAVSPDVRIINLETSITTSDDYWKGKGINYRMHPKNIPCITAADIDCCVLANNHILDWGYTGLNETMETLRRANIEFVGAGQTGKEAAAPAVLEVAGKGRVIVFSYGHPSSGVQPNWNASENKAGVNLLKELSEGSLYQIREQVAAVKRPGDVVVASIHWGGNWGYEVSDEQRKFARWLVDIAGVDLVHGHSSHHVKGLERYNGKLILYGCGDFLNDYEGISGHEKFRSALTLMYFPSIDPATGKLTALRMTPMRIKNFKLEQAAKSDVHWLRDTLKRRGCSKDEQVEINADKSLSLVWIR